MDQFTFKVDLRSYDPFLTEEQDESFAKTKSTWIPGLLAAENVIRKHGDEFTLSGQHGRYLQDMVIGERVFGIKIIEIPDVTGLVAEEFNDGVITVTWDASDLYTTEVGHRVDGGVWYTQIADVGVSIMTIEVEGSEFEVRLRFTNGQGGYSNEYTTASVEIDPEDECVESYTLLPIDMENDWTDDFCLLGEATSNESEVILTPDEPNQFGSINYKISNTPAIIQTSFDFQISTESEALGGKLYYYFGSPTFEELGYVVVLDFTDNSVATYYGGIDSYPLDIEDYEFTVGNCQNSI